MKVTKKNAAQVWNSPNPHMHTNDLHRGQKKSYGIRNGVQHFLSVPKFFTLDPPP